MKCSKCQAEIPEESKFCLKCGKKVEKIEKLDLKANFEEIMEKILEEYQQLEKNLKKKEIKDNEKLKILTRQKELLLMKEYTLREGILSEISGAKEEIKNSKCEGR